MNRFCSISGLGLYFVLILSGCAASQTDVFLSDNEMINNTDIKVIGVTASDSEQTAVYELLQQVKRISVITPEGSEMELDYQFWTNEIVNKLTRLNISDRQNHTYLHTLILRSDMGTPMVMQIGFDSLTIDDQTYTNDLLPEIVLGIRGAIGKQLLADLTIDQLSVFMLDVANHPLDFASEEVAELRKVIESATIIRETTDVKYPLFPHYVIQILNGDKSVVHLDIIGDNIISIPFGKDQTFYYYVSENLFAKFYRTLPPFDFLEDNPKSLFYASAIEISEKGHDAILFGNKDEVSTLNDSITDSFARLLVDGNKLLATEDHQEELFSLIFIGSDQRREVNIYADGYKYKGRYYQSLNIGEKIRKHLESIK